jgi:hypothetical protein
MRKPFKKSKTINTTSLSKNRIILEYRKKLMKQKFNENIDLFQRI